MHVVREVSQQLWLMDGDAVICEAVRQAPDDTPASLREAGYVPLLERYAACEAGPGVDPAELGEIWIPA